MSDHDQGNAAPATDGPFLPRQDGLPAPVHTGACEKPGLRGMVITRLAELPDRALLDERALAEALGVSKRTIRRMAGRYELPPPIRLVGKSVWQVGRVLGWIEARADRLARDAERQARKLTEVP